MCVKFCENRTKPVGVAIWNWLQTSIHLAGHRSSILVCSSGAKKTITLTDFSTQTGSPQGDELWYKSTPVRDSCSLHDIWKLRVTQYRKKNCTKIQHKFPRYDQNVGSDGNTASDYVHHRLSRPNNCCQYTMKLQMKYIQAIWTSPDAR